CGPALYGGPRHGCHLSHSLCHGGRTHATTFSRSNDRHTRFVPLGRLLRGTAHRLCSRSEHGTRYGMARTLLHRWLSTPLYSRAAEVDARIAALARGQRTYPRG